MSILKIIKYAIQKDLEGGSPLNILKRPQRNS